MKNFLLIGIFFSLILPTLSYADFDKNQSQSIMYSQNGEFKDKEQSVDFFALAKKQEEESKVKLGKHHSMRKREDSVKSVQTPKPLDTPETTSNQTSDGTTTNQDAK